MASQSVLGGKGRTGVLFVILITIAAHKVNTVRDNQPSI